MSLVKVLVVDDSAFMRKVISDIINGSGKAVVLDTAKNGKEAIEKTATLKPDVITMDVEMPIVDGISALKSIMDNNPTPVVMLSSITKEGADATVRALEFGAIDFVTKPNNMFNISTDVMQKEIMEKILIASKTMVKKNVFKSDIIIDRRNIISSGDKLDKIIAIGTSTGGPKALQSVLPKFPKNINAAILVVQHMPPGFTKSLSERLDDMSQINVKEASDGDVLKPGWAYIAPGDRHLKVSKTGGNYKIFLDDSALVTGHKPSVDAMYYSLAQLDNVKDIISVIMTGMGADGAKGLVELKKKRATVIAQNEESCVVFGMPKAAINLEVVDKIVTLEKITDEVLKSMGV
jgi:two-component system chemotaxis response regulator CheB